jgi:hypothetical protein
LDLAIAKPSQQETQKGHVPVGKIRAANSIVIFVQFLTAIGGFEFYFGTELQSLEKTTNLQTMVPIPTTDLSVFGQRTELGWPPPTILEHQFYHQEQTHFAGIIGPQAAHQTTCLVLCTQIRTSDCTQNSRRIGTNLWTIGSTMQ